LLRFTPQVTRFPASSHRRVSAAINNPSKSYPSAFASKRHSSRESPPPSCRPRTLSSAVHEAHVMRGAIWSHSREGKFSSSDTDRILTTDPPRENKLTKSVQRNRSVFDERIK